MKEDFRPGDPVTYVCHGNCVHRAIVIDQPTNSRVEIDDDGVDRCVDPQNLYHGHNVTVKIEGEEKPVRKVSKWVNIALSPNGVLSNHVYSKAHDAMVDYRENRSVNFVAKAIKIEIPEEMNV